MLIGFPNVIVQMTVFGFSCFQPLGEVTEKLSRWTFVSKRHKSVEYSIIQIKTKNGDVKFLFWKFICKICFFMTSFSTKDSILYQEHFPTDFCMVSFLQQLQHWPFASFIYPFL